MNHKILLWGAGSETLNIINMINLGLVYFKKKKIKKKKILYLIDPFVEKTHFKTKIPLINNKAKFHKILPAVTSFIVCIGGLNNMARVLISKELIKKKMNPLSTISSYSHIDKTSIIGSGIRIMPNVSINCYSKIGDFSILNTSCTLEHESKIGTGVHIMCGATVSGRVKIGDYVTIGSNATILPDIKISDGAIIGAGAVVTKNVKKNEVVVGNPARFLKTNKHNYDLSYFN